MNIYIKGVNSCTQRKINIARYRTFLEQQDHKIVVNVMDADTVLIWTCGFREDLRTNSLKYIEYFKTNLGKRVIACGCLPSIDPDSVSAIGIDMFEWKNEEEILKYFGGTAEQFSMTALPIGESAISTSLQQFRNDHPGKKVAFCDQFIKIYISEGCTYECTYCSERFAFPPFRSYNIKQILDSVKQLTKKNRKYDIVLFADSLGNWGSDIGSSFAVLLNSILTIDKRIRVGFDNMNPADFIKELETFRSLIKNGRIFYLSLPIQSASDRILALMKRPYTVQQLKEIFICVNEAGFSELVTHVLVGFPTETEKEWCETVDFISRHHSKYVLLSAYMEMPHMQSAKLLPKVEKTCSSRRIREAVAKWKNQGIIVNYDGCDYMQEKFTKDHISIGELE